MFQGPEQDELPPDLILFGEFSELKGPMPLLTIPSLSNYRHSCSPSATISKDHNRAGISKKVTEHYHYGSYPNPAHLSQATGNEKNTQYVSNGCPVLEQKFSPNSTSNILETSSNNVHGATVSMGNHELCQSNSPRNETHDHDPYVNCMSNFTSASSVMQSCHEHHISSSICADKTEISQESEPILEGLTFDPDPHYHGLSLNNLILKLMSTDYQSFG